MKKSVTLMSVMVALMLSVLSCITGSAQNGPVPLPPPTLPIGSAEDLRNYMLQQAVEGSRGVAAPSINNSWSGSVTYTNTSGLFAEDVLDKLFNTEFVYMLENPADTITGYVWLYDRNNNLLFSGQSQYAASSLATNKPQYQIWQQDPPLLSDVAYATVLALNPDGTSSIDTTTLNVNPLGQLIFPSWMAGAVNGLLVVNFTDGTAVTYRLWNGTNQASETITESSAYKITGHYVYEATQTKTNISVSIIEFLDRPTVFIKSPLPCQVSLNVTGVFEDVNGNAMSEHPPSMVLTRVNADGSESTIPPTPLASGTNVENLPAGIFRIKFNWVNFDPSPVLYTGPADNGGGKG